MTAVRGVVDQNGCAKERIIDERLCCGGGGCLAGPLLRRMGVLVVVVQSRAKERIVLGDRSAAVTAGLQAQQPSCQGS